MKHFHQFTYFSLLFFFVSSSSISALPHFFPNESSIPATNLPNTTAGAFDTFKKLSGCHFGQEVTDLSKLKDYFHHFGYIDVNGNSTSNFTDDFDSALESAVKVYQLNFNLNVTGELDEPTVKQILKPRCGVADVLNGSSTMNSGRTVSVHGTVAHYSFFPGRPRWSSRRRNLTYAFEPKNQLSGDVKRVFTKAFDRWSEWTPLTFTVKHNYRTANIKIGFYSRNHGDGEPFDGVLGTLAHAFSPPRGLLHLDSDEIWQIDGVLNNRASSSVDLESVVVHEIGHVLGLGHSSAEEAIMFPTISRGARKVELAKDDVEGIQVLYGTNPDSNDTTGPSFDEKETSRARYYVAPAVIKILLLAVGLSIFT